MTFLKDSRRRRQPHAWTALCWLLCVCFGLTLLACTDSAETTTAVATIVTDPAMTPTPIPDPNTPAGFYAFLEQMDDTRLGDRPFALNQYWAQISQTPLTDAQTAIFLYRGEAAQVSLIGDMNSFDEATAITMQLLEGTDLWYHEASYEPTARLDYVFLINGQRVIDPRNSLTIASGFGLNSVLRMADYVDPPELTDATQYTPGEVTVHSIDSSYLGQTRTFVVYTPSSQLIGAKTPSLYVQDGSDAISLINMPHLLDVLIGRRDVPPMVVVFVPPFDRVEEYWRNDAYADFLAEEVMPFVQETYNTDPSPDRTGLMGASLGGLISLHTAVRHPTKFGLVMAQSSAFSADNDALINQIATDPRLPLRIHMIAGSYETAIAPTLFPDDPDFFAANQRMAEALQQRGYTYTFIEAPQGHSWGFWQAYIGDGLRYLYR